MKGYYDEFSNGTKLYYGPCILTISNHSHMPYRTLAYRLYDERGHLQASCLGGDNSIRNIVPQSKDLNHRSYYRMEMAERSVLRNEGKIFTKKIAYTNHGPDTRPTCFIVNDNITYKDGTKQTVHLSYSNLTYAEEKEYNTVSEQTDYAPGATDSTFYTKNYGISHEDYEAAVEDSDAYLSERDIYSHADSYSEYDYDYDMEV